MIDPFATLRADYPGRFASPERLVFRDLITGSNSSGKQFVCRGEFAVVIDQIPPNPPTDWEMGPKMTPGEYGIFREHLWYPERHGPYAFATGKTPEAAFAAACGQFAGTFCSWPKVRYADGNREPKA